MTPRRRGGSARARWPSPTSPASAGCPSSSPNSGAAGTEELTDLINACFESIVAAATRHGGDVLKIVGDGVLVWFEGAGHEARAGAGCTDMHVALARPLMSEHRPAGAPAHVRRGPHRHVHVPHDLGSPSRARRRRQCRQRGAPLREGRRPRSDRHQPRPGSSPAPRRGPAAGGPSAACCAGSTDVTPGTPPQAPSRLPDLAAYIPASQRELLTIGAPGEHRQCAISFLSINGTDDVLERDGPDALHRHGLARDVVRRRGDRTLGHAVPQHGQRSERRRADAHRRRADLVGPRRRAPPAHGPPGDRRVRRPRPARRCEPRAGSTPGSSARPSGAASRRSATPSTSAPG